MSAALAYKHAAKGSGKRIAAQLSVIALARGESGLGLVQTHSHAESRALVGPTRTFIQIRIQRCKKALVGDLGDRSGHPAIHDHAAVIAVDSSTSGSGVDALAILSAREEKAPGGLKQ